MLVKALRSCQHLCFLESSENAPPILPVGKTALWAEVFLPLSWLHVQDIQDLEFEVLF